MSESTETTQGEITSVEWLRTTGRLPGLFQFFQAIEAAGRHDTDRQTAAAWQAEYEAWTTSQSGDGD